ncbi:MAG: sorbosone dehydrogenase family protein [Myxococcaceae bacterium]
MFALGAAPGDYRNDAPGVVHQMKVEDLPAPYATESASNAPHVVAPANGALPKVPTGFKVDVFASGLDEPRQLRVAPNGDVFVVESQQGRVRVLRAADGARKAASNEVFAKGLKLPFGIAFYPPGPEPKFLYVAETNRVVRFPYQNGDLKKRADPETVVKELSPVSFGHWTRDIVFSADGKKMFVSVGSGSNVAEGGSNEKDRADVLVFDPDGSHREIHASGLRNCVGMSVNNGNVWCTVNERDGLGDDLVPDYVTRLKPGGFYGWPWFYMGNHPDPRLKGDAALGARTIVPDVLFQSHSAPLGMIFYEGTMFPERYRHRAFVALHGSWNRARRTGPKVISVPVKDGVPTNEYEDFLTGLVTSDETVWARPVGVTVARDGALLVSEDGNGTVWRVSYEAGADGGR